MTVEQRHVKRRSQEDEISQHRAIKRQKCRRNVEECVGWTAEKQSKNSRHVLKTELTPKHVCTGQRTGK